MEQQKNKKQKQLTKTQLLVVPKTVVALIFGVYYALFFVVVVAKVVSVIFIIPGRLWTIHCWPTGGRTTMVSLALEAASKMPYLTTLVV